MELTSHSQEDPKPTAPFLKWPGGKRWLTGFLAPILGRSLTRRYFEPFLGSGAMYLALQPRTATLSDINEDLIQTLRVITQSADEVVTAVWRLSNTADCFYRVRASSPRSDIGRAARFLYLNRTAWGGIYRLNRFGEFNTPFGNSGRVICRRKAVVDAARHFERADLECTGFEDAVSRAQAGDVVYADPPYAGPNSGHESFMRYTPGRFRWRDQVLLAEVALDAAERGAVVAVSGRSDFEVEALYPGWTTMHLARNCRVSRRVDARAAFNEVVLLSPNANLGDFDLRSMRSPSSSRPIDRRPSPARMLVS